MRRRIRGLTGIKIVTKKDGRKYRYRRVGDRLIPLPDLPEHHPDFIAAYADAGRVAPKSRDAAGTIAALSTAYLGSSDHARLAPSTRNVWRRTIDRIKADRGDGLVIELRAEHLRKDIRKFSPGAAQNRLKAWRAILKFAVEEGWISSNPVDGIKAQRGEVVPHRQWTRGELEAYRKYWPVDSQERIAFEVIYWSGARCVDAVTLGWHKVDGDGWLGYIQAKTKGPATCPIRTLPAWARQMERDHNYLTTSLPIGQMIWIITKAGKPRSVKGLSQWMSAAASTAGLPDDCTAHGLRKARAAALAESGATASQIGAWTGHASLSEISHYTRQADQKGILGANAERETGNQVEQFPNSAK